MARKIERSCHVHADQDIGQCMNMLDDLVDKFQRSGLLDDKTYTGGAVRSLRLKGVSSRAILKKMQMKGVPADMASEAIRNLDEDSGFGGDMAAAARYVRRRKLGPFSLRSREGRAERDLASMARAGYSFEIAQKILRMAADEIESLITAVS